MEPASLSLAAPTVIYQLFKVGQTGYRFIRDFISTEKDSKTVLIQFDTEGRRFQAWGEITGVSAGRWKDNQGSLVDKEALNTICLIALYVTDAQRLVERYGLQADSTSVVNISRELLPEPNIDITGPPLNYESLHTYPPLTELLSRYQQIVKTTQTRISAFGKFRWVLIDRGNFKVLVNQLKLLNDALYGLLDTRDRINATELLSFDTLNTNNAEALADISAAERQHYPDISKMAALKSQNLATNESKVSGAEKHLVVEHLEFLDTESKVRTLADFKAPKVVKSRVLVEWKRKGFLSHKAANKTAEEVGIQRIEKLVRLLASISPEMFKTLTCVGYHIGHHPAEVGLVYKLPASASQIHPPKSLDELIRNPIHIRTRYGGKPPLEARFRLAYELARALSGLHNVEWLHKGISTRNVLFFHRDSAFEIDIEAPYLTGFDFSREFKDQGLSENLHGTEEDQYRHPQHVSGSPFQKR